MRVCLQYVVADDQELQVHLVEMLVKHCSLQTVAQWSLHYNVPRDRLPIGVWDKQQSLPLHLRHVHTHTAHPNFCEALGPHGS